MAEAGDVGGGSRHCPSPFGTPQNAFFKGRKPFLFLFRAESKLLRGVCRTLSHQSLSFGDNTPRLVLCSGQQQHPGLACPPSPIFTCPAVSEVMAPRSPPYDPLTFHNSALPTCPR